MIVYIWTEMLKMVQKLGRSIGRIKRPACPSAGLSRKGS